MQASVKTRIITSCGDLKPDILPDGSQLRVYRSTDEGKVIVSITDADEYDEAFETGLIEELTKDEAIQQVNEYHNR